MKIKKLLLTLSVGSIGTALPIIAVSCNNSSDSVESLSKEAKTVFDEMSQRIKANPEKTAEILKEMAEKFKKISEKATKLSKDKQEQLAKKIQEYTNELVKNIMGN